MLKDRLSKMKKKDYATWYVKEIRRFCKVRLLKPQRQLKLTVEEEALRCKLTWQQYDWKMWQICFGDMETLKTLVLDAERLQREVQQCVLGFSDQVPWWGMACGRASPRKKCSQTGGGLPALPDPPGGLPGGPPGPPGAPRGPLGVDFLDFFPESGKTSPRILVQEEG